LLPKCVFLDMGLNQLCSGRILVEIMSKIPRNMLANSCY
jgi:hypothetical protein